MKRLLALNLRRVDYVFLQINITRAEAIQKNTIVVHPVIAISYHSFMGFYSISLRSKLDHSKSHQTTF